MRLHILGVSGTFMSGVALLAKQAGHIVSGSDMNIYPPVSTQLSNEGILCQEGYDPAHIDPNVDCVVVGNVIKRGNPAIEYVLDQHIPYVSGPEWLFGNVLKDRSVLAVSGTHGKTTTSSMLTWILSFAGLTPGYLIGGVPENFGSSAALGKTPYFVIEGDEYDCAFFDKRSKFLHYRPQTLILNNLEYDHADIFPDLAAIKQQFHYLLRTVPNNGAIVVNAQDLHLQEVLAMGCYTPVSRFGGEGADWQAELINPDGSEFRVHYRGKAMGTVKWLLLGYHNVSNALAAIAAASCVGVPAEVAIAALPQFKNVKRRLEIKAQINNITVYDDFAHHPTAIATTLAGLRAKLGAKTRMIAVLEFGSYSMRTGAHKEKIQEALKNADVIVCKNLEKDWGLKKVLSEFSKPTYLYEDVEALVQGLTPELRAGDHVIIMSNAGFGGIHQKLIDEISKKMA